MKYLCSDTNQINFILPPFSYFSKAGLFQVFELKFLSSAVAKLYKHNIKTFKNCYLCQSSYNTLYIYCEELYEVHHFSSLERRDAEHPNKKLTNNIGVNSGMSKVKHVLLTGPPGVGKTTLTQKVCKALSSCGVTYAGFYTEELRVQGRRIGFDVISVPDGERKPLARVEDHHTGSRGPMVGQYVVNVPSFESVALSILHKHQSQVLIVDEVGKMELFSSKFEPTLQQVLKNSEPPSMLATIPIPRGKPLPAVERLCSRPDIKLITVDRQNRDSPALLQEIVDILSLK